MSSQPVLAIDFGTTATCVATCAGPGASPQVVTHQGPKSSRLPSGVMWWEGQLLVGSAAYNRAALDPAAYDETPKRSLSQGDRYLLLGDQDVDVVDALAAILAEAARPGLAQLAGNEASWVLTHPAAWGVPQLELLRAAAARAGAATVTLLAEPVAAAWGVHERNLQVGARLAVFDWGGGTLDTAVLHWDGTQFTQAGPAVGEDPLGGEDVDYALEQFLLQRLPDNVRGQVENPASRVHRRLGRELRQLTRLAKEELSASSRTELALSVLEEPIRVTLEEFNALVSPIVERCAEVLRCGLTASGVQPDGLAAVYLVGDSSRIPLVYQVLRDLYPGARLTPAELGKEAVARGAALAAVGSALTAPSKSVYQVLKDRYPDALTAPSESPDQARETTGRAADPPDAVSLLSLLSTAIQRPQTGAARVLRAPGDRGVDTLAFSPDGRLLACGIVDSDHTSANLIRLWNPETAALVRTLKIGGSAAPPPGQIKKNSISFGGLGIMAASVGGRDALIVDFWYQKVRRHITNKEFSSIYALASSRNGQFVAVKVSQAGILPSVILFNVSNGHVVQKQLGGGGEGTGIAFSRDSRLLAFSSQSRGGITIAAMPTGELGGQLRGFLYSGFQVTSAVPTGTVDSLTFSPDGQLLAYADIGEKGYMMVTLWEIPARRVRYAWPVRGRVNGVAFSPDGRLLAAAESNPVVRLWDPATGRQVAEVDSQAEEVNAVAFSPDGRFLAIAADAVQLWPLPL